MQCALDLGGRPIHFLGIGGIGMSALAHVLLKRQLPISGSDLRSNAITDNLESLGAQIFWQQEAANLHQLISGLASGSGVHPSEVQGEKGDLPGSWPLPQIVCSTAIHQDNPEYRAALALGCPIFHRSDVLAALFKEFSQSIAIAGTHGKTTTSSLVGYLLLEAGLDPTIVVGGEVAAWGGNARVGSSPYFVAEADESDGSLVKFSAQIGVITNIELDHPDHYSSLDQVVEIFHQFIDHCQVVVACIDCPTITDRLLPLLQGRSLISYGLGPDSPADYTVGVVNYTGRGTTVQVVERGMALGQLTLQLLGQHNLSNALAAVAIGRHLGLEFSVIATALASFGGTKRRFESYGEAQGICFVDDYAHHPSEIQSTLASARLQAQAAQLKYTQGRVIAVFQPHRYSRALTFLSEFSQCFADADVVIATDIYAAGEIDTGVITGQRVAAAISAHHPAVYFQPSLTGVIDFLQSNLQAGDTVLFLGAGNLNQIIPEILAHYQSTMVEPKSGEVVLQ